MTYLVSAWQKTKFFIQKWPVLSVALFITLVGNQAFWTSFFRSGGDFSLQLLLFSLSAFFFVLITASLLLHLFNFKYLFKPILILVLLISSFAAYFMDSYGIFIDVQMIHNTMETDSREVSDLLSMGLLFYVLLTGILPAYLVSKLQFEYRPFPRQLLHNLTVFALALVAVVGNFYLFSADYASLFKNHHQLRYLINPSNYIYSTSKYLEEKFSHHDQGITQIGLDARQANHPGEKNSILVLVVGETARAMNFSLNGYSKKTNPMLSKEAVINYPNVHSCGTSTHVSLPCMFSHFNRRSFSESEAPYYENLTDVLNHAGIEILWRDNNSGCKGVCKNIKTENMNHLHIQSACNDQECFDEVMLNRLDKVIESSQKDMVIILHQKGSHGPAYYARYPQGFNQFKPNCETNELQSCSHNALVNTYDNTIMYTDYFLSRVIDLLKTEQQRYDTAMLYVSDHGESLGENHVYLHSIPYMIAPEEQTHVPFISWFSPGFMASHKLDRSCMVEKSSYAYSHDNIFHSVLGLMNISTSVYNPQLDIYQPCSQIKTVTNIKKNEAG